MPPLDLSVLNGNDPAGYKTEAQIKERIQKSLHPDSAIDWERRPHHQGVQQNPGSIAAADSGQFHAYRKNRRHELDRIEAMEKANDMEKEREEFEKLRKEKLAVEEAKTAKRRAKRKKFQFKKQQKQENFTQENNHESEYD